MNRLRVFALFLYDFVIGDDWRIAVGVVVALGLTGLVSDTRISAWWVLPLAVAGLLGGSVWSASRSAR